MPDRAYLDWNATAPLRPEARAAMIEAMDVVGNPSSVHTEGRAAKMIVEKAREQVAALVGCDTEEVVFTSGATEAAMLCLKNQRAVSSSIEHECVLAWTDQSIAVTETGRVIGIDRAALGGREAIQMANGETGVVQEESGSYFTDATQAAGKIDYRFSEAGGEWAAISSHKLGGVKGVGAVIRPAGRPLPNPLMGGGQEGNDRAGTQNVVGIASFGAAAVAAKEDLAKSLWSDVVELVDDLESALRDCAGDDLTIFGKNASRLPNTSCFAIPGWKGETQVMQLDLAGFAVSAGSACSSGKVGPSRVLKAMGFDDITASSAIRVSMGPTTTKDEVSRFIDAWTGLYKRMKTRAA